MYGQPQWAYAVDTMFDQSTLEVVKGAVRMKTQVRRFRLITRIGMAAVALVTLFSLLRPNTAKAHCDSVEGPVVAAARSALEAKDVTLILPYVQVDAEE